jgi:hypothetical protein
MRGRDRGRGKGKLLSQQVLRLDGMDGGVQDKKNKKVE